MSLPDYLICLECDTPCYTFEWRNDKPYDILCEACGNEEAELFVRPDEVDELDLDWNRKTSRTRGREEESPAKGSAPRREET
jgi:hypothetical protein